MKYTRTLTLILALVLGSGVWTTHAGALHARTYTETFVYHDESLDDSRLANAAVASASPWSWAR